MSESSFPLVRIGIEGMRHSILTHLAAHHDEIEKIVAEELGKVISEEDIREIVKAEAPRIVKAAVTTLVEASLSQIKWDNELRQAMDAIVLSGVQKVMARDIENSSREQRELG